MHQHNLLIEGVIPVRRRDGATGTLSLPEVLALLGRDDIESFTSLAAHQSHAWHAFLVQLAAIALHRAGTTDSAISAEAWAGLLRAPTGDFPADEPWCLVVSDLSRPAFLQPPVPETSLKDFKTVIDHPDDFDVLITAKNHMVKTSRMSAERLDLWLFALVTLQTMEGFLGRGNYGIARMNGGFASRPAVTLVSSARPGSRFRRELAAILAGRDPIVDQFSEYRESGGLALTWLAPWNGGEALPLSRLDPLFIEVCRRVRLTAGGAGLRACLRPTEGARIAANERKGNLGDPWAPIELKKTGAQMLTVGGFDYRLLVPLLLGVKDRRHIAPSLLQKLGPDEQAEGMSVLCQVLARGQGQTAGWHERILPLPRNMRRLQTDLRELARRTAAAQVEDAGTMRAVFSRALSLLLRAGKEGGKDGKAVEGWKKPWLERFDPAVDACFFTHLWDRLENEDSEATEIAWWRHLRDIARGLLDSATRSVPLPGVRRHRAIAAADRSFAAGVLRHFAAVAYSPGGTPAHQSTEETEHVRP